MVVDVRGALLRHLRHLDCLLRSACARGSDRRRGRRRHEAFDPSLATRLRRRRDRGGLLLGQESVLTANRLGGGAARGADLGVDVLDVVADGLRRDHEPAADLLVRQPAREQPQHLDLARGQARRALAAARHAVAGGAEHGLDRVAVEAAGPDLGAQLARRPPRPSAPAGGARLAHRLVGVGGAEDPRRAGDRRAGEPARVARAVEALAVLHGDRAERAPAPADWCSMRSVRYGCMRTRSHSPAPSGPGLSQIEFDTPSRPKPCTRPARRSVRTSPRRQPELRRRRRRQVGDGAGVPEGVRAT